MKKNIKSINNIKGFSFELKLSIDNFNESLSKRDRNYEKNNSKSFKDFEFSMKMEAEAVSIDFDIFAKEVKEEIKTALDNAATK